MYQSNKIMEIVGRIKKFFEEQTFSGGFRKRELVITTQEQYPQDILIEFTQDRIGLLNNFNIGDEVKISINIRGREWINPEGVAKYFNSIQGWRIEAMVGGVDTSTPPQAMPTAPSFTPTESSDQDDLPF